ncbi:MAG: glycosyltransferase family 39 protein, partial [Anaerolineae bacterium]
RQAPVRSWAMLLVGAAVLAFVLRRLAIERPRLVAEGETTAPRWSPLLAALFLAAVAWPGFAGNRFRLVSTLLWLGAMALLFVAFRGSRGRPLEALRRLLPAEGIRISWHAVLLLLIVAVGAFLRLYQLDMIPREMGVDMPLKYENAREILQGQFMIFCPRYPGRESLFFYLLALYGRIFGLSFFAIKFTTAWLGIVTIPALYGVARYLYNREVGIVAAALLAVNKWHVILSRSGYRSIMVPLFIVLLIWTTVRALRHGRSSDFALAGVVLGLGMYTYNSFWIVPALWAAVLAAEIALHGRGALRTYGWGLLALGLGALLVYLPLAYYALEYPREYWFRVASRVTGMEAAVTSSPLRILAGNLWRAAGMFNQTGDGVFYMNVPHQRQFGVVSAVLLAAGVGYALWRWRRGHHAMLLIVLSGMILPTALAVAFPHEVPNAARASGVLTPALLLAALPPVLVARRLQACWELTQGQVTASIPRLAALGRAWSPAEVHSERAVPSSLAATAEERLAECAPAEGACGLLGSGSSGEAGVSRGGGSLTLRGLAVPLVLLALVVGVEARETWHAYFTDYVQHLPQGNYAISLEMARVLDDFEPAGGASFIKVWPYWFDGNALRAQLKVKPKTWDWELAELDTAKPPLGGVRGQVLVLLHPDDHAALQSLKQAYPCGIAVTHYADNHEPAFIAFYAER